MPAVGRINFRVREETATQRTIGKSGWFLCVLGDFVVHLPLADSERSTRLAISENQLRLQSHIGYTPSRSVGFRKAEGTKREGIRGQSALLLADGHPGTERLGASGDRALCCWRTLGSSGGIHKIVN